MKILHLTLHRKWFDLIASGEKTCEYRDKKEYWRKRFKNKDGTWRRFGEVHFRNGYAKDAPFMRVQWLGIWEMSYVSDRRDCYAISLGEILELRNYNK